MHLCEFKLHKPVCVHIYPDSQIYTQNYSQKLYIVITFLIDLLHTPLQSFEKEQRFIQCLMFRIALLVPTKVSFYFIIRTTHLFTNKLLSPSSLELAVISAALRQDFLFLSFITRLQLHTVNPYIQWLFNPALVKHLPKNN